MPSNITILLAFDSFEDTERKRHLLYMLYCYNIICGSGRGGVLDTRILDTGIPSIKLPVTPGTKIFT